MATFEVYLHSELVSSITPPPPTDRLSLSPHDRTSPSINERPPPPTVDRPPPLLASERLPPSPYSIERPTPSPYTIERPTPSPYTIDRPPPLLASDRPPPLLASDRPPPLLASDRPPPLLASERPPPPSLVIDRPPPLLASERPIPPPRPRFLPSSSSSSTESALEEPRPTGLSSSAGPLLESALVRDAVQSGLNAAGAGGHQSTTISSVSTMGGGSLLQGHLYKQGVKGPVKGWKRRFFIQKTDKLFYFVSSSAATTGSASPKGFIDLLHEKLEVLPEVSYDKSGFGFLIRTPGRDWRLVAESHEQRHYWVSGIVQFKADKLLQGPQVLPALAALQSFSVARSSSVSAPAGALAAYFPPGAGAAPHHEPLPAPDLELARLPPASSLTRVLEAGQAELCLSPFPGEAILWTIRLVSWAVQAEREIEGSVCVSNYRVLFIPTYTSSCGFDVPLTAIQKLREEGAGERRLSLLCSDFRTLTLHFKPKTQARRKFKELLATYSPASLLGVFAFCLKAGEQQQQLAHRRDGWLVYHPSREFERFGIGRPGGLSEWRVTSVNAGFRICTSYPELLAVPADMSDVELELVAAFRSRGRFPTLTWVHPTTRATLSRCSQPCVGMKMATCAADEKLIRLLSKTGAGCQAQDVLMVADARQRAAAVANTARGAGYESSFAYKTVKMRFLNIANIHAMRKSGKGLHVHAQPGASDDNWFSALGTWLGHIKLILSGALKIIGYLEENKPVLLHCSDGWDRTPQLASLVQLMVDPYYRTIEGFIVLVEKEWCSYGHKFADRCTHYFTRTPSHSETCPVFVQFLDCVFQLAHQYPTVFEFNVKFLVFLSYHAYSGCYGTFLCNSPQERVEACLSEKTVSVWTHIFDALDQFQNTLFTPTDQVLRPLVSLKALQLFKHVYFLHNPALFSLPSPV